MTTVRSGNPFARAVRMKSSPIVSSIPALVSRAYRAAYRKARVIHGRTRFRAQSNGFWVIPTYWTLGNSAHL
jgi:hypothetical protein